MLKPKRIKTKCFKLKLKDTIYIFACPVDTPLHTVDVMKSGYIRLIRVGKTPGVDVFGKALGKFGGGYNKTQILEDLEPNQNNYSLISAAISRTKLHLETVSKHSGTLLPELSVVKYKGQTIEIHQEEPRFYFIVGETYCANCEQTIPGIHKLEINKDGKVCGESSFIPTEEGVVNAGPHSKKLVHGKCAATPVEPSKWFKSTENFHMGSNQLNFDNIPKKLINGLLRTPEEYLCDLLNEVTAKEARGATKMYLFYKKYLEQLSGS